MGGHRPSLPRGSRRGAAVPPDWGRERHRTAARGHRLGRRRRPVCGAGRGGAGAVGGHLDARQRAGASGVVGGAGGRADGGRRAALGVGARSAVHRRRGRGFRLQGGLCRTTRAQMRVRGRRLERAAGLRVADREYRHGRDGAVDDSYGIQVAKLADLPNEVIDRAQVILNAFEQNGLSDENVNRQQYNDNSKDIENKDHLINKEEHSTIKQTDVFEQTSFDLFNSNETQSEIEAQIKNLNISNMTPIEALLKLSELQNQLR